MPRDFRPEDAEALLRELRKRGTPLINPFADPQTLPEGALERQIREFERAAPIAARELDIELEPGSEGLEGLEGLEGIDGLEGLEGIDGLEGLESAPTPWGLVKRGTMLLALGRTKAAYRLVDRGATSWAGFHEAKAILDGSPTHVVETGLRLYAAQADVSSGAADNAASAVLDRVQKLLKLQTMIGGPGRKALRDEMTRVAPIHAAPSPYGPVDIDPIPYEQRRTTVTAGGRTVGLRYFDVSFGNPTETLLLVHGHGSSLEELPKLVDRLVPELRVVAIDFPGCGYSEKPEMTYTVDFYMEVLLAFLEDRNIDRCFVAGGSLGGNVTLRFGLLPNSAQRFPRLVAWAPAGWIKQDLVLGAQARDSREKAEWFFWATYECQKGEWYSDDWDPAEKKKAYDDSDTYRREVYSRTYQRAYFDIAADQLLHTNLDRAPDIEQPVLLMCGQNDTGLGMYTTVSEELWPRLDQRTHNDFFDDFTYGKHSIATMEPELVAQKIKEWLTG